MDSDSIKELESKIWDYQYYKSIVIALAGNTSHSQYEHYQDVIKMCDSKISQFQEKLLKNKIPSN